MKITVPVVAVWLALAEPMPPKPQPPAPAPTKCCSKCGGTGMVPTGDGITRVWCECPPTCPCAKNRPKPQARKTAECTDGSCRR